MTIIDLKDDCYQIEIEEKHKKKTIFDMKIMYIGSGNVYGIKECSHDFFTNNEPSSEKLNMEQVEVYLDEVIIQVKMLEVHEKFVIMGF
jgi:hypothetical protein